jgi:DNA-binding LytR/AlgR family response regulator
MMNCVIADDEPLARKRLENFLNEIPFLKLTALCSNALEVMNTLTESKIDLLFLDIQMPKMTGISLLKTIPNPPLTIMTTAYQNYALEGYELSVIDYLLKPFSFERFALAVNKAKKQYDLITSQNESTNIENTFFFFKPHQNF